MNIVLPIWTTIGVIVFIYLISNNEKREWTLLYIMVMSAFWPLCLIFEGGLWLDNIIPGKKDQK